MGRGFWSGRASSAAVLVTLLVLLYACGPAGTAQPSPAATLPSTFTLTPTARAAAPVSLGPGERWIEVSLAEHVVRLHDGDKVVAEYSAATGAGTQPAYVTYPGLFEISQKYRGPEETAPGVYVEDVLVFDLEHGNGFHSFPMDKDRRVLDTTVGKSVTAGCVRVAESAAVYDFGRIGTKVWVH